MQELLNRACHCHVSDLVLCPQQHHTVQPRLRVSSTRFGGAQPRSIVKSNSFFALVLSKTRLFIHRSWSKPSNLESIKDCTSTKACPGHKKTVWGMNDWEPTPEACQLFTWTTARRPRNMLSQNKKTHLIGWKLQTSLRMFAWHHHYVWQRDFGLRSRS